MRDKPDRFQPVETWATDPAPWPSPRARPESRSKRCIFIATCWRSPMPSRARFSKPEQTKCSFAVRRWHSPLVLAAISSFRCAAGVPRFFCLPVRPTSFSTASQNTAERVMTAPTAYRAMTQGASQRDLAHVRCFVSAGEHLPFSTFRDWESQPAGESLTGSVRPSCCTSSSPVGCRRRSRAQRDARCPVTPPLS